VLFLDFNKSGKIKYATGNLGVKNMFCLLILSTFVWGCAPRDVPTQTLKSRLLEGEIHSATADGERLSTCPKNDSDWQDVRIHENDYEKLIVNSPFILATNGYKNCQRVGNRTFISNDRMKVNGSLGYVRIIGLYVMSAEQFNKDKRINLKGVVYSLDNRDVERVYTRNEPRHQGMVHLTVMEYVPGTSSLETSIRAKYKDKTKIDSDLKSGKIINIEKDGELMASCNGEVWNEFRVHSSKSSAISQGNLMALVNRGDRVCHQIGQVADITVRGQTQKIGKVKIKKIQIMELDTLKKNLNIFENEATLKVANDDIRFLEGVLSNEPSKAVNVIFFETQLEGK